MQIWLDGLQDMLQRRGDAVHPQRRHGPTPGDSAREAPTGTTSSAGATITQQIVDRSRRKLDRHGRDTATSGRGVFW